MQPANRLQETKEYYFSKKLKEVRALAAAGHPIINMGIGSPDLPAPQVAIDAMIESMQDKVAHQYQSYTGIPALREAMVSFYNKQYGVEVHPDNEILPLMGSKEGIMHISMAFLNPGDKVLFPNPGYPSYAAVTRLVEAEAVTYDLTEKNGWLPDLKALAKQDLTGIKLMWVNYPHMPTGTPVRGMFYGLQKGAIAALGLDKKWFDYINGIYGKRRKLVFELVEKLKCTYDKNQVGLFVWAKLPEGIDAESFIDKVLLEKHIFITPGTIFGTMGEGYIRFSLCAKEEEIKIAMTRFDT